MSTESLCHDIYRDMLIDANTKIEQLTRDKTLLMTNQHIAIEALRGAGANSCADYLQLTLTTLEKLDVQYLASLDQAREEVRALRSDPLANNRFEVLPTNPSPEASVGTAKGLGITGKFSALFKRQAE